MAIFRTSSLAASDTEPTKAGIFKKSKLRMSKSDIVSHKMFGKNRGHTGKDIKIGKLFKKHGPKDHITEPTSGDEAEKATQGLGPDMEEFDNMIQSAISKKKKNGFGNMSNKKPNIQRKMFD
jgi:hypothetical protein